MIKNYLTYIKENKEISNNFVVFIKNEQDWFDVLTKLEEMGFEWVGGDKPTSLSYYDEYDENEKEVIWVDNGVLTFSSMIYYMDKLNRDINTPRVLDFETMKYKKFKKIERPDIDPYGEEDWGYEEIKENHQKKFEIGDVVRHKKNPNLGNGIVVHIQGNNVYINFENTTGVKVTYPNCEYNHGWSTGLGNINLYDFLNVKLKRIEKPDVDPYGEEDWGYEEIKENNSYEVYVNLCDLNDKYRNKLNLYEDKLKELLLNKEVRFVTYPTLDQTRPDDYIWIGDIITDLKYNRDNSIIVTVSNGKKYYLLYLRDGIFVMDKDLYEKEQERKKKLRELHKEIDPYGEEDWDLD